MEPGLHRSNSKCPYCGERQAIEVDVSEGLPQNFVWDCSVCCRPMAVTVVAGGDGRPVVRLRGEDEVFGE